MEIQGDREKLKERILIIDDDEGISKSLSLIFRKKGYDTDIALNGHTAVRNAQEGTYNLALLDLKLPDMGGLDVLERFRDMRPDMNTIIMTAYASVESAVEALTKGASAFLTKPLDMNDALALVRETLDKQRVAREKSLAEESLFKKVDEMSRFLDSIQESPEDAVISKDLEGNILSWDKGSECIYDYTDEEFLGRPASMLMPPEMSIEFQEVMAELRRREGISRYETECIAKDGRRIHVSPNTSPLRDASDSITRALTIARGIIKHKPLEEELRKKNKELNVFFNISLDLICIADTEGYFLRLNPAWEKTLGYTHNDLMAKRFLDFIHPDDMDSTLEAIASLRSQHEVIDFQNRYRSRDGSYRWIEWRLAPAGNVIYAAARDITDRKLVDEEIEEYRGHLEKLVAERTAELSQAIEQLKLKIEERKRTEDALRLNEQRLGALLDLSRMKSPSLQELTAFCLEEAVALTRSEIGWLGFMNEGETAHTLCAYSKTVMEQCRIRDKPAMCTVETAGLWGEVVRQRRPIIINDYAAPNPGKKGCPEGHVGIKRNMIIPVFDDSHIVAVISVANKGYAYDDSDIRQVTLLMDGMWRIIQRQRSEEELSRLNTELEQRVADRTAQLEAANRELEAFSYSVSHDLRSPLRAIDGFSRVLLEEYADKLDSEAQRLAHVIRDNTYKMGRLIDNLLEFSRVGRHELKLSCINMTRLAESLFHEMVSPEEKEKISFSCTSIPDALGEYALIRQVWRNLLSNALKFASKKSPIIIEVSGYEEGSENVYWVSDNGAGFDMRYAHKLFTVFNRLHGSDEFEGTGVGLAIVQRIVHRHGGRVWAEAEPGKGAKFYFSLPGNK